VRVPLRTLSSQLLGALTLRPYGKAPVGSVLRSSRRIRYPPGADPGRTQGLRLTLFRRTREEVATPPAEESRAAGKGRPTPSRKEAEAAAKARAKPPRGRKELAAAQRSGRTESSQRVRQGMRNGEEKYLLARDKGPVRRFIRDYVDSRFGFIELIIPLLVVTMVLGYSGISGAARIGNAVLLGSILLVIADILMLRFRLRRQLAARFPDEPTKGTTYYAMTRAMQMKFMRLPKSQVKVGQELPEHYR
jgi:hypothetical protein